MELLWKGTSAILLLMLSGSLIKLDCWSVPLSNVTYDDSQRIHASCNDTDCCESSFDVTYDIQNINATCSESDSCESSFHVTYDIQNINATCSESDSCEPSFDVTHDILNINATCSESDSCEKSFDVTYNDIQIINGTCKGRDSCESPRNKDTLDYYTCNCNSYCSLFGTCCADSKHKHKYPKPLKPLYCDSIFQDKKFYHVSMINGCDPDFLSNKTTKELCNSTAELSDNPVLNVPVTDPVTGISYKNYYCFACNTNYGEQEPMSWKLELKSHSKKVNGSLQNLRFDISRRTWVLDYNQENATDVFLHISIPETVKKVIPYCYNFSIISDCASNWTDDSTRNKCLAYMALVRIPVDENKDGAFLYYRNPHCAICNYQSIDDRNCNGFVDNHSASSERNYHIQVFSLRNDTTTKCGNNMVYDRFAMKCRRIYRPKKEPQS